MGWMDPYNSSVKLHQYLLIASPSPCIQSYLCTQTDARTPGNPVLRGRRSNLHILTSAQVLMVAWLVRDQGDGYHRSRSCSGRPRAQKRDACRDHCGRWPADTEHRRQSPDRRPGTRGHGQTGSWFDKDALRVPWALYAEKLSVIALVQRKDLEVMLAEKSQARTSRHSCSMPRLDTLSVPSTSAHRLFPGVSVITRWPPTSYRLKRVPTLAVERLGWIWTLGISLPYRAP